jgi:hypothetical protein
VAEQMNAADRLKRIGSVEIIAGIALNALEDLRNKAPDHTTSEGAYLEGAARLLGEAVEHLQRVKDYVKEEEKP